MNPLPKFKSTQTYQLPEPITAHKVLETAASIIEHHYLRGDVMSSPDAVKAYCRFKIGLNEKEVFAALLLDNQHQLIEFKTLALGTVDSASVHPREVVKEALLGNAAAVIFTHNHPSGIPEPSNADKRITKRLNDALTLVDIRVLDHIIVGKECVSFSERGWI
ncbi:DNA repair protein RadC [Vibrio breoganii]